MHRLKKELVQLSYLKTRWRGLVFPDASDLFGGYCVTQVSAAEKYSGMWFDQMQHGPLVFVSGAFRGSKLNWPKVEKEGFAIVVAFQRLVYLLWQGTQICW